MLRFAVLAGGLLFLCFTGVLYLYVAAAGGVWR
jgi:hypothetical protein